MFVLKNTFLFSFKAVINYSWNKNNKSSLKFWRPLSRPFKASTFHIFPLLLLVTLLHFGKRKTLMEANFPEFCEKTLLNRQGCFYDERFILRYHPYLLLGSSQFKLYWSQSDRETSSSLVCICIFPFSSSSLHSLPRPVDNVSFIWSHNRVEEPYLAI